MKNLLIVITCLFTFSVGIVLGESHRGKGLFFNTWYDQDLYYGEVVKVKHHREYTHFYNSCKKATIIGLQAADTDNLAWVVLEDCPWTKGHTYFMTFSQDELEKNND